MGRSTVSYLEQKAYNRIREMIITGELKVGEKIIQDQIAETIGVSRTPLRRALAELERDYLLDIKPHGIYVREVSDEFVVSVWEVRAVLEGLACRLCAERIDEPTIAYMRSLFETSAKEWQKGNNEQYFQADMKFHSKLVEIADNPILKRNYETTQLLNVAFNLGLVRSPDETYQEHMNILDGLERRDADYAERMMLLHIRNTIPYLLDHK